MPRTNAPRSGPRRNLGFLLAKAAQRFNERLLDRLAAGGFPEVRASYGSVLVPLFERDGLRLGELALAAHLSKQAMTGLVKQCEADGLVERARDRSDARAFNVRLTPRGRELRVVAERALGEFEAQLTQSIGRADHDALIRALKGVIAL